MNGNTLKKTTILIINATGAIKGFILIS